MPVPEASVHEHNCPVFGEDEVRLSWNGFRVEAITKAGCEESPPKYQLGLRVLAANTRHDLTAFGSRENICPDVAVHHVLQRRHADDGRVRVDVLSINGTGQHLVNAFGDRSRH